MNDKDKTKNIEKSNNNNTNNNNSNETSSNNNNKIAKRGKRIKSVSFVKHYTKKLQVFEPVFYDPTDADAICYRKLKHHIYTNFLHLRGKEECHRMTQHIYQSSISRKK